MLIQVMVLDLILVHFFHLQVLIWEKNLSFLELVINVHIDNKEKDILVLLSVKVQHKD